MRAAILGAGSLGCAIGGKLAGAGHEIILINRNAAQVEALERDGLTLVEGERETTMRVEAARAPEGLAPVDLLIVLVKSFHTREAARAAAALLKPDGLALSLQNGLGHEEILAETFGADRVIGGKTYVGGLMIAPGRVAAGVAGKETIIGELSGGLSPRVAALAGTLEAAGLHTIASPDIMAAMWDKLLVNVATGALSAITRLTYGDLYRIPAMQETALAAVREAMAVAAALGVAVTTRDPLAPWVKASAGLPADFKASMLQSLEKGSITEIDFINGAVTRAGRRTGVPTPVNDTLVACVRGVEIAAGAK